MMQVNDVDSQSGANIFQTGEGINTSILSDKLMRTTHGRVNRVSSLPDRDCSRLRGRNLSRARSTVT